MIKRVITSCLLCLLSFSGSSQIRLLMGAVGGRYNYLESQQANMAAKFNLGYDYSYDPGSNTPGFSGSTDVYTVTKELHWDRLNRGLVLGVEWETSAKMKHSIYFEGKTNRASGKRTNETRNFEETFMLKSKFGGFHYNFTYCLFDRLGIFYDFGVTRYRIRFTASSPAEESFKNKAMGLQSHLSSGYKPGSKSLNLVNGLGIDIAVVQLDKLQVSLRPEIGFAFNKMSNVGLGVLYNKWIFNLNYVQCGFIIKAGVSK